ncbi:MAG: hypothetical protein LBQ00_08935 [Syntrophobacterales bacterium]|jgi:hypothetical protein|nr:hypothetical protein [Syntrophobacterales bacterium]
MMSIFPEPTKGLPKAGMSFIDYEAYLSQSESMRFGEDIGLAEHSRESPWAIALEGKIKLVIDGRKTLIPRVCDRKSGRVRRIVLMVSMQCSRYNLPILIDPKTTSPPHSKGIFTLPCTRHHLKAIGFPDFNMEQGEGYDAERVCTAMPDESA